MISYKTTTLESNVKTNKIVSTKWTFHKDWSFASNYFIFSEILFQFKNFYNELAYVPTTQMPIFVLFERDGVSFDGSLSL